MRMNGQNTEVVDKLNYISAMLENTRGWNKQKTLVKANIKRMQLWTNVYQ